VTKAAQIHLVKSLALIAGPIRVNSVSPGILFTVRIPTHEATSCFTDSYSRNGVRNFQLQNLRVLSREVP
jgi:NAD(P)-dependent dehydrogenase (short-subunit alcohol dehydrogenase family)